MYWYISVLPPTGENILCDTNRLIEFLERQPELKRTNDVTFASVEGQPRVDITIVKGTADGNWSSSGTFIPQFNRVEIVCSDHRRQDFYAEISARIAGFLQWRLVTQGGA